MGKRIYLSSPTMHGEEMRYIQEAFDTNWIAPLGANVDAFEKELATYVGISHAAALSAGTAALHLALKLAGVGPGDVVFCSDLTFAATVNPVSYEKGRQVFIDSERDTWNMDPRALEAAFARYPHPKAVIVVHLYGTPAKMEEILAICGAHGVPVIEDAAESLGATYQGKQTGTLGKYGVYSFNGNKIITTSGGGMLVSEDKEGIDKARFWSTQAREPARHYEHKEIGYNYRMSNVVAGIGRGQLKALNSHIRRKREIRAIYEEGFADMPWVKLNPVGRGSDPNCWLTCITLEEGCGAAPVDVMDALAADNIESRPIWKPMHLQPVFGDCPIVTAGGSAVDEEIYRRGLCLPSDIKMTADDQQRVIDLVRQTVKR